MKVRTLGHLKEGRSNAHSEETDAAKNVHVKKWMREKLHDWRRRRVKDRSEK